jgi:hypothetical protein
MLSLKQRLDVAAPMENVENEHVALFDAVDDDIRTDGQASQTKTKIVIAAAPYVGMFGENKEVVGDRIDEAFGSVSITALGGNVEPNLVQFRLSLRTNSERHQR